MSAVGERLAGRVALVTGGSDGIGLAVARRCLQEGARVMIVGRRQERLDDAVHELGAGAASLRLDVAEPDAGPIAAAATLERFGRLDVLVNNVAVDPQAAATIDVHPEAFATATQVNVTAPFAWTQACWRAWMAEHGGVVLNMGSLGGIALQPMMGVYNVTKAALHHLTRVLAAELGPGVRVNAIAAGLIRTPMSRPAWDGNEERLGSRMPLGRLGEPEDVAATAAFLVSDDAAWMTGEVVVLDGGAAVQLGRPRDRSDRTTRRTS